jgi:transcriptional regulator with XRE-family HTH domain
MIAMQLHTPQEVQALLRERVRTLRLQQGLKQTTLATRAGVPIASYRRFERTGRGSVQTFLRVAHALGRLDELSTLLEAPAIRTIDDLEASSAAPPARGRL